ncbi:MAG: type II toxin-antitoxin system HigB family toxin [Anaerolineae bacterium]|nr:type II toxin-antitoxin system HigB family toxin [Anaerolineae bacterium]
MPIITRKTLAEFWQKHPNAENPLKLWFVRTRQAQWHSLAELRRDFLAADLVRRVIVFNIGGGNYRLVARVEYQLQRVYVRQIMTHAEYDKGAWKNDLWFT